MASVALAVTADIPIFEAATACEVFGRVRADWVEPWYDFTVCAAPGVRFGGWFRADTPHGLDELAAADTVIVPAGHDVDTNPPAELVDAIRAAHDSGARIASICTGAFVLAAAGLLDGRRVTTHWMHAARLARAYPNVHVEPDVLYIDDGDILTSAGTAAGIDLCLHIVRIDYGIAVANQLARRLVTAPHRPGGQAQFIPSPVPEDDQHPLADLFAWALGHLDEPLTVTDLARQANMSPRNLSRHFAAATATTPLQWLLTQRIHRAQELLETTDHSIDHIADTTGMGTAATLRRHFHRVIGVPPDTYRRTFHQPHARQRHAGTTLRGPAPQPASQRASRSTVAPGVR
jgi:AraC family transcriptional activator FtrA